MRVFVHSSEDIKGIGMMDEFELYLDVSPYEFLQTFNKEEYKNIKLKLKKQIDKL